MPCPAAFAGITSTTASAANEFLIHFLTRYLSELMRHMARRPGATTGPRYSGQLSSIMYA
jgi:hypothetical protein